MSEAAPRAGNIEQLLQDEPYPGVSRRRLDSSHATIAIYHFQPGASFPLHKHSQEQITLVEMGEVKFTVAGTVHRMGPDDWSLIPPNVEHGLRAGPQGARLLAIVVPKRQGGNGYTVVVE